MSGQGREIVGVDACEVLDSRGRPTVWCEVSLACGASGSAAVPSGESTSSHERKELRDGERRYRGRGTRRAAANASGELASAVTGLDAGDQALVDQALVAQDGTPDLARLGSNAVLAVSVAVAVAAAKAKGISLFLHMAEGSGCDPVLPLPMVNILSGGAHAGGCLDAQDFLVVPVGAESFSEALEWSCAVREAAREVANNLGHVASLAADEGGLGLPLPSNRAALDLLCTSFEHAGYRLGTDVAIAVDLAANHFATDGGYYLRTESRQLDPVAWVEELDSWRQDYPIVSIEDPLAEDDWEGWRLASQRMAASVQLLGDDVFATDLQRLERAAEAGVANAVLVKPNQIGTLSGAAEVLARARSIGYATVVSARSGETEDSWLADLAVGWGAGQVKVGSTTRAERTAKWNRILRIEHALGRQAVFAGSAALAPRTSWS